MDLPIARYFRLFRQAALLLAACVLPATLSAAPIRILPFGESTTDGGGTESYRKKLGDQLTAHGIAYDFIGSLRRPDPASWDADHQGMSGRANIDLNNWMNANAANYPADIILLWQGTNDCAWGWQYYGPPIDSLSALIDRICEKQPHAEVFVSSIPMMGQNAYPDARGPGEANAAATVYNDAMPALISAKRAQGKKVHFVDTRGVLQVSDLMGDGIHPTQAGYDKMVPYWFAAIQPFLTPSDAPPAITSGTTVTALLNAPFSYTILASGLPTSFTATGLPAGLSLNSTTGVISGTPTANGTSVVALSATNANGTGTANLTLTVSDEELVYSADFEVGGTGDWFAYSGDGGVSHALSAQANGPDSGTALNLAVTVAPGSPYWYAGLGVTLNTPVPFTVSNLPSTVISLDVYAGTPGSPTITVAIKTPSNGKQLEQTLTVTGNTWTTLTLPLSGFSNNGFDYNASFYEILISPAGAGWPNTSTTSRVDNVQLTRASVAPAAPVITSPATAAGTINTPFTYTITATGSPTSFSATGLPAGLSLDPATGVISGTPTSVGTTSAALAATNAQGTGTATLALTIGQPGQVIYADTLASNTYFWGLVTWTNAGGSVSFANGYLSYNSALSPYVATYGPSGRLPWDGNYTPLPDFSPLFAPGNRLSITFEARASAPNGVNGLTLEAASSYDPHHLYVVTTPALTSTWTSYTFSAVNLTGVPDPTRIIALALTTGAANLGTVDVRRLRIEALAVVPAPAITSATTTSIAAHTPFTYTITATSSPTSFSAIGLPAGLSLNPATGVISGTPTTPGESLVTLGATNARGTGSATLTLTVTTPPLSPIEQWSLVHFGTSTLTGDTAPSADFDGDGQPNLLEYALDSDPTDPASVPAPVLALSPSPPHSLSLTFLRARADVTYEVLATSDLASPAAWEVIATNPETVSSTTPVTVTDTAPVSTNSRRFLRLRVTAP